jgi:hypothetical protein
MHGLGLSLWTGEDVPELTAPPKEVAPKLIALKVGDANWKKVEPYIVANKTTPLADIIKTLGAKYTQGSLKVAEKAIKKLLA